MIGANIAWSLLRYYSTNGRNDQSTVVIESFGCVQVLCMTMTQCVQRAFRVLAYNVSSIFIVSNDKEREVPHVSFK